jgi:tetratricopeptide (TPR) repeat protein
MLRVTLSIACIALLAGLILGQSQSPPEPGQLVQDARRQGWEGAILILGPLESSDSRTFPGIRAFAEDLRSVERVVNARQTPGRWPGLDADVMVTRNPNFWRAFYEIALADPAFLYMHAGLLLSGGDAHRAAYVLFLARQRPGVPKELRRDNQLLLSQAIAMVEEGDREVQAGIKLFDAGDKEAAIRKYREALTRWPQNGWADYELGYALRTRDEAAHAVVPARAPAPAWSHDVLEHFAAARRHDPLRWEAYQGGDREVADAFLALKRRVLPAWEKIKTETRVDDDVLLRFAEGCQEAGIHDLALVARQIVVARRGRFAPADHPFISTSLRKLVPGDKTELVLKRLGGEKLQLRQLVTPDASSAP